MITLVKGGLVLLREAGEYRIEKKDVIIEENQIAAVADEVPAKLAYSADKVIDAFGKLVMPGLINAHTHAYMSLFRNYADDLAFFDWLNKVQAVEDGMTEEDCYWGTMLS